MDASRLPRASIDAVKHDQDAVLYPACCRGMCLLALMESADPRLIWFVDSKSSAACRLGVSRSDLFAIIRCRTLRNR